MALTNDPELAERMTRHRSHGMTSNQERMEPRPTDEIWNYQQIDIGHNYRMTDIQAALGLSQMQQLDEFVQRRHQIARCYDAAFDGLPVITPWQRPEVYSSYHLYPIRVSESQCGKTQRQVYDALWEVGIAANLHYIPVYRQPYYEALGFNAGYCPEAERFHKETISLPMYPTFKENDQMYVMDFIRKTLT